MVTTVWKHDVCGTDIIPFGNCSKCSRRSTTSIIQLHCCNKYCGTISWHLAQIGNIFKSRNIRFSQDHVNWKFFRLAIIGRRCINTNNVDAAISYQPISSVLMECWEMECCRIGRSVRSECFWLVRVIFIPAGVHNNYSTMGYCTMFVFPVSQVLNCDPIIWIWRRFFCHVNNNSRSY